MHPRRPEEPPVPVDSAGDPPPRLAPGKGVLAGTTMQRHQFIERGPALPGTLCQLPLDSASGQP